MAEKEIFMEGMMEKRRSPGSRPLDGDAGGSGEGFVWLSALRGPGRKWPSVSLLFWDSCFSLWFL